MLANDLILFAQVVELGSFSKVAEANDIANSVVSKRIGRLEEELNTQLLYRTTRKLSLTEAGKRILTSAQQIKEVTQEVVSDAQDANETMSGRIIMSVPTISGELLLADAVADFCSQHPHLSIEMSMENNFVDPVEEGIDLLIRTGHLDDSSLIARHLIDSQWVVCASPRYLEQITLPSHPSQLIEYNCFAYSHTASMGQHWQFKDKEKTYSVKVNGSFSTNNAAALRKAALGGYGLVYVPKCLVHDDIVAKHLVVLFENEVAKKQGVYAIHPYIRKTPKKITALIEHLRQAYRNKASYFSFM